MLLTGASQWRSELWYGLGDVILILKPDCCYSYFIAHHKKDNLRGMGGFRNGEPA
jgi:hypothetical protein